MIAHLYKIDLRDVPGVRSYAQKDVYVVASNIDDAHSKIKAYITENDMILDEHFDHLTIEKVEVLGSYFENDAPRYTKKLFIP